MKEKIHKEYEALVKLVLREYKALEKIAPEHELLRLLKNVEENSFTITQDFLDRYYRKNKKGEKDFYASLDTFGAYYGHLELAIATETNKNGKDPLEFAAGEGNPGISNGNRN